MVVMNLLKIDPKTCYSYSNAIELVHLFCYMKWQIIEKLIINL